MVKLDHIRIAVNDYRASRDWYVDHLGLKVEFEVARRGVTALRDDSEVTLLLEQNRREVQTRSCVLYFRVGDVDTKYHQLSMAGVRFVHPPRKKFWGYGPELKDPDGYRVRLWDEKTMNEKG
jgi:catechol 2,3-dioxygenase-like lactoylglutathione lyase family enzyme